MSFGLIKFEFIIEKIKQMINFFYLYIKSDNLNMIIQNLYTMSSCQIIIIDFSTDMVMVIPVFKTLYILSK